MDTQTFYICLVPEGAEYISPLPDAIEYKTVGMGPAVGSDYVAILPKGWEITGEPKIENVFVSICPDGMDCKCGRGAQRDDVLKWWWYLDRNVFDFLGLNFMIRQTRRLTRVQVSSTEHGLLFDKEFKNIPLQPGEDCQANAEIGEYEKELWLINPTPGHAYYLTLYYEQPVCSESRVILYETTEYTGARVVETAYGKLTSVKIPQQITETITFKNSGSTKTTHNYLFGIEKWRWLNSKYSLGYIHWVEIGESDYVWADFIGDASLEVTYTANITHQTFEYLEEKYGGEPYVKVSFQLYGNFWVKISDFSKFTPGNWCLIEKHGTVHPEGGDPFAVYSAWDHYDTDREIWIKELRKYISSKPYDVLFTSENVARIKPPSDNLIVLPRY